METEQESFKEQPNITRLVLDTIRKYQTDNNAVIDPKAIQVIVERGQKEQEYLEEELKQEKITADDIVQAINELLLIAWTTRDIAHSEGWPQWQRKWIGADAVREAMQEHCPFYPWC